MKHLEVKATALTWSTLDLSNQLGQLSTEQQEIFANRFGKNPEDYKAYLEFFFESIQDSLIEQINNDLEFQINEDIG